jgi:hypothetical protein
MTRHRAGRASKSDYTAIEVDPAPISTGRRYGRSSISTTRISAPVTARPGRALGRAPHARPSHPQCETAPDDHWAQFYERILSTSPRSAISTSRKQTALPAAR